MIFNRKYPFILGIAIIVMLLGMHTPLSDIAEIPFAQQAWCMVQQNDFSRFCQGFFADIPSYHLPQWIAAISMDIFGKNALAFRIPLLALAFLGTIGIWNWTRLFFRCKIRAGLAALMWLTSFHVTFQLFNGHPFFAASVFMICALWLLTKLKYSKSGTDAILAGIAAAAAFASGGLFVLLVLMAYVVFTDFLHKSNKLHYRRNLLVVVLATWLAALPVLYALVVQFGFFPTFQHAIEQLYRSDLARHPASVLSFSYMHAINYLFIGLLPWTGLFVVSSLIHLRFFLVHRKFTAMQGIWITAALVGIYSLVIQPGIIQFVNYIIPFLIVFTVDDLVRIMVNENQKYRKTAKVYSFVMVLTAVFLIFFVSLMALYSFPMRELRFVPIFALLIVLFVALYFFIASDLQRNLLLPIGVALFFILFFKIHMLPWMLQQELMPQMAHQIQKHKISPHEIFTFNDPNMHSLSWYLTDRTGIITHNQINQRTQPFWLIIDNQTPEEFLTPHLQIKEVVHVPYYHTLRNFQGFFNPQDRAKNVRSAYLVHYTPKAK